MSHEAEVLRKLAISAFRILNQIAPPPEEGDEIEDDVIAPSEWEALPDTEKERWYRIVCYIYQDGETQWVGEALGWGGAERGYEELLKDLAVDPLTKLPIEKK